ncbi:MAG: hypothetical protein HXS54_05840 [Theionarchaea archaeon]|nr:hypothetical protein [Theionarchaea archaeon]
MVKTESTFTTGLPGAGPPQKGIDRSTFKKSPPREELEKSKSTARFQLAWKLVTNKKFQEEYKRKNPGVEINSGMLYQMAKDILDNNTPEEIEKALMNLQSGKESMISQFRVEPQGQPLASPPTSYNRMKQAIEVAVDAALAGKTGEPGGGGRTNTADLALKLFALPDEEVQSLWDQTKKSPGGVDVSAYLPEAPPPAKSTATTKRQLPTGNITPEDLRKFAMGQR